MVNYLLHCKLSQECAQHNVLWLLRKQQEQNNYSFPFRVSSEQIIKHLYPEGRNIFASKTARRILTIWLCFTASSLLPLDHILSVDSYFYMAHHKNTQIFLSLRAINSLCHINLCIENIYILFALLIFNFIVDATAINLLIGQKSFSL